MARCGSGRKTIYISYEFESKHDSDLASSIKEALSTAGFNVTDFNTDGIPGAISIHERRRLIEEATWTVILKTVDYETMELQFEEAMVLSVACWRKLNNVVYLEDRCSTQGFSSISLQHDNWREDLLAIVSKEPPARFDVCYNPNHLDLTESLRQVASRAASAPAKLTKGNGKASCASSPMFSDWVACNVYQSLKEHENERRAQFRLSCCSDSSIETVDSLSGVSQETQERTIIRTGYAHDVRDPNLTRGLKSSLKKSDRSEPVHANPSVKSSVSSKDTMKCNFLNVSEHREEMPGHQPSFNQAFQPDTYVKHCRKRSSVCAIL